MTSWTLRPFIYSYGTVSCFHSGTKIIKFSLQHPQGPRQPYNVQPPYGSTPFMNGCERPAGMFGVWDLLHLSAISTSISSEMLFFKVRPPKLKREFELLKKTNKHPAAAGSIPHVWWTELHSAGCNLPPTGPAPAGPTEGWCRGAALPGGEETETLTEGI